MAVNKLRHERIREFARWGLSGAEIRRVVRVLESIDAERLEELHRRMVEHNEMVARQYEDYTMSLCDFKRQWAQDVADLIDLSARGGA